MFSTPFYRYYGHIELRRFKEYYGMPRGHDYDPVYSLSIRNMAFTLNFSEKRRSLLHPNTAQRSFPNYNLILRKLLETMP